MQLTNSLTTIFLPKARSSNSAIPSGRKGERAIEKEYVRPSNDESYKVSSGRQPEVIEARPVNSVNHTENASFRSIF